MAKSVDLDLKKAIVELQVKMVETCEKIEVIDSNIRELRRGLRFARITRREIRALLPGRKAYKSLGVISLFTIFEEIKGHLKNIISLLTKRTSEFKDNKLYLEKELEEIEDNIIEMVQQLEEQTDEK